MAAPAGDARGPVEGSIRERVPPLLTDLYQFTMAYAHWRAGRHREPAVFELFFRDNPFCGGFSVFAGLHDCLLFLRGFRLSERELDFLRSVLPPSTHPDFFDFLRDLDCSDVSVRSVPEGSVVFARVPLMEVSGPLAMVQLLETSLLCLVNYASLVCSNAARFRLAAGPSRKLLEMGLRRAQGPDGGLSASRYSYIGGFDLTSNVQAGLLFGIPVAGTMAHSFVTSFSSLEQAQPQTLAAASGEPDPVDFVSLSKGWLGRVRELLGAEAWKSHEGELAAFLSYAVAFPRSFLPVIDSYSVTCSGLPNFCAVAAALCELGYQPVGVRLDSGDLCRQSVEVRRVFRLCSQQFSMAPFLSLVIVGSNNISEHSMRELSHKESEIDTVGVGTHLVTCTEQPSLGCVYKLVEVRGLPRMKISEDPEKSTVPGRKRVHRLVDDEGHVFLDLLSLEAEPAPEPGRPLTCFPLGLDGGAVTVTPAQVTCLRQEVFSRGQVTQPPCSSAETRARVQDSLRSLHPRHKRLQEPDSYTVALSLQLHSLAGELRGASACNNNFLFASSPE
ncbi:nicotinate phosphoribosyltransferase [Synchiropus splendidus]|uniref:nicotinate phosphoribosyltransferase n=1 Tax=Synchiropus splendidus TaxID=270530 RepID=UPI00237E59DB|nr:nicotinate phosphoribosyltransferase [Synchiropus splendidus]